MAFFHDVVPERGINPTKGKTLSLGTAAVLEGIVCKSFAVAVVVVGLSSPS